METTDASTIAKELGKRGGLKTLEKYGNDHFKKLRQISIKKAKASKKEPKL